LAAHHRIFQSAPALSFAQQGCCWGSSKNVIAAADSTLPPAVIFALAIQNNFRIHLSFSASVSCGKHPARAWHWHDSCNVRDRHSVLCSYLSTYKESEIP
jgi:hypothetical protein